MRNENQVCDGWGRDWADRPKADLSERPAGHSEVRAYMGGESGGEKVREVNPEEDCGGGTRGGCGVLV